MAEYQIPAHGTFCWNELATNNLGTAQKFYSELLGWKMKESDATGMKYIEFKPGSHESGCGIGGMYQMGPEYGEAPSHWMAYVAVEDVDSLAGRVESLGGKVCVPPTDIPNVGRFSVITDPTGATLSIIKLNGAQS